MFVVPESDANALDKAGLRALVEEHVGRPTHVAEVAACQPPLVYTSVFMDDPGCLVELFEPWPGCCALLRERWGDWSNVKIHEVAITLEDGPVSILWKGTRPGSTHLKMIGQSPRIVNNRRAPIGIKERSVPGRRFSHYDDGTLDFILLDCEGSEWFVLQHMVSRPKLIQVELAQIGRKYRNPNTQQIEAWMVANGYERCGVVDGDDVFVRC